MRKVIAETNQLMVEAERILKSVTRRQDLLKSLQRSQAE